MELVGAGADFGKNRRERIDAFDVELVLPETLENPICVGPEQLLILGAHATIKGEPRTIDFLRRINSQSAFSGEAASVEIEIFNFQGIATRSRRYIAVDAANVHSIRDEPQVYAMRALQRVGRLHCEVSERARIGEIESDFGGIGHHDQLLYFFESASISGTPSVSINSRKRCPVIGTSSNPVSLSWRIASRIATNAAISVPVWIVSLKP